MQQHRITTKAGDGLFTVTSSTEEFLSLTAGIEGGGGWRGENHAGVARGCRKGDPSLVPASDKLMSQAESLLGFERKAFTTINDVAGGVPNVGAYLAGNPLNMRRRKRVDTQKAPLTIVLDLTNSASCSDETLALRGATVLTLLRLLSATRPVMIYAGSNLGTTTQGARGIMTPIESAPINLSQAAFICKSSGFNRNLGYGYCRRDLGSNGHWPFNNLDKWRENGAEIWGKIFGGDILFIPPLSDHDTILENPIAWIGEMLAKYGEAESE